MYGKFTDDQIELTKKSLRGNIFFLLLCVDKKTAHDYKNVDVNKCFTGIMYKLNGLNTLLFNPLEIVITMSLLRSALNEYNKKDFNFQIYRKLILDAGTEIMKL